MSPRVFEVRAGYDYLLYLFDGWSVTVGMPCGAWIERVKKRNRRRSPKPT